MHNDIDKTQNLTRMGSMSREEFFGEGGGPPIQDLPKVSFEGVPADVIERASKMLADDKTPASPSTGGGYPVQSQPQPTPEPKTNIHNVQIGGKLDIDLFQLAVGKDIIANIDNTISQYEASIDHLQKCRQKLCQLLNITEKDDEQHRSQETNG